ncbi:hypothetical protein NPIL_162731 [Nephila pilipes]|uniref:Uncharacterized protein n=1 Tax=Nephila pilipes TaxID=299642 RepID=A0A8X6PEU3_NEPPI|nr:hypothetical protein NPIL_162731 [Nephila pilipes]
MAEPKAIVYQRTNKGKNIQNDFYLYCTLSLSQPNEAASVSKETAMLLRNKYPRILLETPLRAEKRSLEWKIVFPLRGNLVCASEEKAISTVCLQRLMHAVWTNVSNDPPKQTLFFKRGLDGKHFF